jgi:hypothetical protein
MDQQIHILHRNCAEKHVVAKDQGAGDAGTAEQGDLHRGDVIHQLHGTIGKPHLALFDSAQTELQGDMKRDAQVQRPCIDQRFGIDLIKLGLGEIAQPEVNPDQAHGNALRFRKAGTTLRSILP